MTDRPVRALAITAPGQAEVLTVTEPAPQAGQAWVETLWSGISAGTEVALLRGDDPHHRAGWDSQLRTFGRGRRAGYPIDRLGYMEVARVLESRTQELVEGRLVAVPYGHRSAHCADPSREPVILLPGDLDPVLGVYVSQLGPICANGVLHAAVELAGQTADVSSALAGRRVLVTGAGVVGLLTALLAQRLGAEVVVAEPSEDRCRVAARLGLDAVRDDGTAAEQVKERWVDAAGARGAEVALQCRGHSSSLVTALESLQPQRTVVDLGFYQGGAPDLRLGEEFHHNWLTIRCAQIGRVPRGTEDRWNRQRLAELTLDLLRARGDDIRRHLVTHVADLDEGPRLLQDIAARRGGVLTAVLRMKPPT